MPVPVSDLTNVVAVSGGGQNAYALRSDGTVWEWGLDTGTFLTGPQQAEHDTPAQVSGLTHVVAVAGGYNAAYALRTDGTVWAWGFGALGQPGENPYRTTTPLKVRDLPSIRAVAGGWDGGYAIATDGSAWEIGTQGVSRISGVPPITSIASSDGTELALATDGTVWNIGVDLCAFWTQPTSVAIVVEKIPSLQHATKIAAGQSTGYALLADGTVWAWGTNTAGALGDGDSDQSKECTSTPIRVLGLSQVTDIVSFGTNAYALRSDGTVWSWGAYNAGALGNGTDAYTYPGIMGSDHPVEVSGLTGIAAIGASYATGYAVVR